MEDPEQTLLALAMVHSAMARPSSLASGTFAAAAQCSESKTWNGTPLVSAMVLSVMAMSS